MPSQEFMNLAREVQPIFNLDEEEEQKDNGVSAKLLSYLNNPQDCP